MQAAIYAQGLSRRKSRPAEAPGASRLRGALGTTADLDRTTSPRLPPLAHESLESEKSARNSGRLGLSEGVLGIASTTRIRVGTK